MSIMQHSERPVEVEMSIGIFTWNARRVCNARRRQHKTCVDASHTVHKNMTSHMVGAVSFG